MPRSGWILHDGRRKPFSGRIQERNFSVAKYPPYEDGTSEVRRWLSGVFSEDFGAAEITMTTIIGKPEVRRWLT